jgi:hypothetical protein
VRIREHHRRDKCLATEVVREECAPGLRPARRAAAQIPRDSAFRNGDAELQQFAVDPRSAPETILRGHTPNQIATGRIDAWSSGTSRAAAPASTYTSAMPSIDSGWLNEHKGFPPVGPEPAQKQPQQPVSWAKAPIRGRENGELMAQRKSLEQEVSLRCVSRADRSIRPDDGSHRLVACRPATPTSMISWPGAILARPHQHDDASGNIEHEQRHHRHVIHVSRLTGDGAPISSNKGRAGRTSTAREGCRSSLRRAPSTSCSTGHVQP